MNLRYYRNTKTLIAKLADQAHEEMSVRYDERMKTEYPGDVIFYDMFNKRFSELMLQECVDNLFLNGYDDAANQLLKHFNEAKNNEN